jgi:hypothetical protein
MITFHPAARQTAQTSAAAMISSRLQPGFVSRSERLNSDDDGMHPSPGQERRDIRPRSAARSEEQITPTSNQYRDLPVQFK